MIRILLKINFYIYKIIEIINSKVSRDLSLLFTVLIDYISINSNKLEDKLVSQISLLLTLQVTFKEKNY